MQTPVVTLVVVRIALLPPDRPTRPHEDDRTDGNRTVDGFPRSHVVRRDGVVLVCARLGGHVDDDRRSEELLGRHSIHGREAHPAMDGRVEVRPEVLRSGVGGHSGRAIFVRRQRVVSERTSGRTRPIGCIGAYRMREVDDGHSIGEERRERVHRGLGRG